MSTMPILYTHTDFDGVACAVLITSVEEVGDIRFVEPEDIQKKLIEVKKGCIVTDLPFHPNAGKWFDHHASNPVPEKFEGRFDAKAKSAARVILDYYENPFLNKKFSEFVDAVDKIDSASFSREDLLAPSGYYLLSLSLDADKTASSSRAWKRKLIELLKEKTLAQILELPDVKKRIETALAKRQKAEAEVENYTAVHGSVCVTDVRNAPDWVVNSGLRFQAYLTHPECGVSLRVRNSKREGQVDISLGENIFSRTNRTDLGAIARRHGGGGHKAAAGFSVDGLVADAVLAELIKELNDMV